MGSTLSHLRFVAVACVVAGSGFLAGCAATPFGGEERDAAAQSTGAPIPIEATYDSGSVSIKPAALVEDVPPAAASGSLAPTVPNINQPPAPQKGALLSPEEKAKVIAELEAMAKKQGVELNKERAAAQAACDNLSADVLRKKMLEGAC